ncbi:MAG: hypothetical protein H0X02_06605, partial [Nitrosomonas sp.]|nr:hypothetical protein [Nitrosomonas sp.]
MEAKIDQRSLSWLSLEGVNRSTMIVVIVVIVILVILLIVRSIMVRRKADEARSNSSESNYRSKR